MHQVSIEKYFETQAQALFAYAVSIHVDVFVEDALQVLHDYVKARFEHWSISVEEVSEHGNTHLQCYGETAVEFTKNERKQFQPKGKYYKYLNHDIKKPFGCSHAKRSRYYNVMYCLKAVSDKPWHCTETDPSVCKQMVDESRVYQGDLISNKRRSEQSMSYESKITRWYLDKPVAERPQSVEALSSLLIEENMVPWQHCHAEAILRITRYVLMQFATGSTRERERERMIQRVIELDRKIC